MQVLITHGKIFCLEKYYMLFKNCAFFTFIKFKGPAKSFEYWGLKLLPGIRIIAEGLAQRPRPKPPTHLELHPFNGLYVWSVHIFVQKH